MSTPQIQEYLAGGAAFAAGVTPAVTLTTGGGTQAGWWLVAVQAWDVDSVARMSAPGGTYTDWRQIGFADAGKGVAHIRVWVRKVDTAGAKTVMFPGSATSTSDNHCRLYVLSGVRDYRWIRLRASGSDEASTNHIAAQTYSPDVDALLIGVWMASGLVNYTLPGSLTSQAEMDTLFATSRSGYKTVSSRGPTGTLTATSSASHPYAAVQILISGPTGAIGFPAVPLKFRVEIAPGADLAAHPDDWPWVDISAYALTGDGDGLRILVGKRDEGSQVEAAQCDLVLRNPSGRFSPRNPLSPYYGLLGKRTPIRVWLNPGSGLTERFSGFVPHWPPRWSGPKIDQRVSISARGILWRLGRGRPPQLSQWTRTTLSTQDQVLLEYWPCEDEDRASSISSALPGGQAMAISGTIRFGGLSSLTRDVAGVGTLSYGTAPLPDFAAGGQAIGVVPAGTSSPVEWSVTFFAKANPVAAATNITLVRWSTPGGTHVKWEVRQTSTPPGGLEIATYNAAGVRTVVLSKGSVDSELCEYRVDAIQNGANIDIRAHQTGAEFDSDTLASSTLGRVNTVILNPDGQVLSGGELAIGHVRAWGTQSHPVLDTDSAADEYDRVIYPVYGYGRESAPTRLARLAAEDGVLINVPPVVEQFATRMDSQLPNAQLDLYRECADADGGVLQEDGFALGFLPRQYRYNPVVVMVLDYAARQVYEPFEPVDDDQRLANVVVVSRTAGGQATAIDETGPNGTAAIGRLIKPLTVNVAATESLQDRASQELSLGSLNEYRYPAIGLSLTGSPELIAVWLDLLLGAMIRVTNPPEDLPPGDIDLLVEGWTETVDSVDWTVRLVCSPASPWQAWTVEASGNQGRLDTAGSTLASGCTATATSLSVSSNGRRWTTTPAHLPFDIEILDSGFTAGERCTVTAISGATPQVFTVVRSVNGASMAHSAGAVVRLWKPATLAR